MPIAKIGVLSVHDVNRGHVLPLISEGSKVDFVLNVPSSGRFLGDAINFLCAESVGWGGLGDAYRALRDFDHLARYENRERKFFNQGLRQHPSVNTVTWIDDHRVRVDRRKGSDLVIFMGSMYQPTAESVREAVERYGEFEIFAATNPNSDPTVESVAVGEELGFRVLKWRPTLAALRA